MQYLSFYLDSPIQKGRVFDVFDPEEGAPERDFALFFVHGGGWRGGTRECYHILMDELARRGYMCASADYRLKAKDIFEQLSDLRESFDRFVEILKSRGGKMPKIATYGGSAGAHLSSLIAFTKPGELGEDISKVKNPDVRPAKAILHATPYDFLPFEGMMPQVWESMQSIAGVPYDKDPERYEKLSLKNHIRPDNPEVFYIEAEYEHGFDPRLNRRIALQHRAMGINSQWKIYDRVEHGFLYELKRKMQISAFEDICLFLEDRLQTDFEKPWTKYATDIE